MAEKLEKKKNNGNWAEQASRFMRNINALGAVAFAGAAVLLPVAAAPLLTVSAINAGQAGFFEVTRQMAAKNAKKKNKK